MATRLDKLARARLYFVCDATPALHDPELLLDRALCGGVDIVQLRDHNASDDALLAAAPIFRAAADRHDALFILNDRPDLVAAAKADGVHVGQDDTPVAAARAAAGEDAIVGLSSHRPEQLAAALAADGPSRPDYISIGPVWATPTKPGRPAAGLDYVRHAAAHAGDLPWFAIGGIDATNIGEVAAAGASRVVVVRALRDVSDPQGAARGLLAALSSPAGAAAP